MTVTRLTDDEKGLTPVFEMYPQHNEAKSKLAGRPIFDEIELCRVYIAGYAKEKSLAVPAHEVCRFEKRMTDYGVEERIPVTYAMRFNKQYLEFKQGGPQSFSGTLLSELPFLSQAERLELKALHIHTAEALAALEGQSLKMLGPGGRDKKNKALAYLESAEKNKGSQQLADELSKRDAQIAELQRRLDSVAPASGDAVETAPVSDATIKGFETFEDDDLRAWLTEAGVTVDGRWSRATLIAKADEVLKKTGKLKTAA